MDSRGASAWQYVGFDSKRPIALPCLLHVRICPYNASSGRGRKASRRDGVTSTKQGATTCPVASATRWRVFDLEKPGAGEVRGKDLERVPGIKTTRYMQCRTNSRREYPGSKSAWRRGPKSLQSAFVGSTQDSTTRNASLRL